MLCDDFQVLENQWMAIRAESQRRAMMGTLTQEEEQELFLNELAVFNRMMDHRTEHGCQKPASRGRSKSSQ